MKYSLMTFLLIMLTIAGLLSSAIAAQDNSSNISAPPIIYIFKDSNYSLPFYFPYPTPTIYTDNGNQTLWLKIIMPYQVYDADAKDTINWAGGHLTSVSYQSSWQNNKTINIYDGDSESEINFSITNIPYGSQHLQIFASCFVLLFKDGFSSTYPVFGQNATKEFDFIVSPSPTVPEFPATLATTFLVITTLAVAVVSKRKHLTGR